MRFFSIVPSDANSEAGIMPDPSIFADMAKLAEEGFRNGTLLAQDGVKPSAEGARVKFDAGKVRVVDGPFAESKELVAGWAILRFPTLDAAIAEAKRLPMKCEIEIRQIVEAEDLGADPASEAAMRAAMPPVAPGMHRYVLFLKSSPEAESGAMPSNDIIEAMNRYNAELVAAKAMLGGEGFHGTAKGARVDLATGKVTKGPFGDPRKVLAGYWMIQAASLADAIAWAKKAPIKDGEIEVRTVFELADFPAEASRHFAQHTAH
ncbi:MAG: hypothetical protein HOV81_21465 [Kofleriaceae bacterium]|nr:hypothetical protein [Kofleriaceae bacterium]